MVSPNVYFPQIQFPDKAEIEAKCPRLTRPCETGGYDDITKSLIENATRAAGGARLYTGGDPNVSSMAMPQAWVQNVWADIGETFHGASIGGKSIPDDIISLFKGCNKAQLYPTDFTAQDCPGHECAFVQTVQPECPQDRDSSMLYLSKAAWDRANMPNCCMGLVNTERACDPRWSINDPTGVCAANVMQGTCSQLDTQSNLPLMLVPGHPCFEWYNAASPHTQPYIDTAIDLFCGSHTSHSACDCFFASERLEHSNGYLYTSISGGVAPIVVADVNSTTNRVTPASIGDSVCLYPRCVAPGTQLVLQTWSMKQLASRCPTICYQVLEGNTASIGSISAGGIYIDDATMQCGGGNGFIANGKPVPRVDAGPIPLFVPVRAGSTDPVGPFVLSIFNDAQPGASPFSWVLALGNAAGVTAQPMSGSVAANAGSEPNSVQFWVDPSQVSGVSDVSIELSDADTNTYVSTSFRLFPFATSVPGPKPCTATTCTDPGSSNQSVDIVQATPDWVSWVLIGLVLFVVLGAIRKALNE
jgi:hypothetical protein